MDTAIKRKNIDLPIDVLRKLSLMAVAQGKSLKAYIEQVLIAKADSISVEVSDSPSPSGDAWFDDQHNMEAVGKGVAEMKEGKTKTYTMDDIQRLLGV